METDAEAAAIRKMAADVGAEATYATAIARAVLVARDTYESVTNWLGGASTQEAARDSLWRLRRALQSAGLPELTGEELEWRGSLLKEVNDAGYFLGDDGLMHYDPKAAELSEAPDARGLHRRIYGNARGPTMQQHLQNLLDEMTAQHRALSEGSRHLAKVEAEKETLRAEVYRQRTELRDSARVIAVLALRAGPAGLRIDRAELERAPPALITQTEVGPRGGALLISTPTKWVVGVDMGAPGGDRSVEVTAEVEDGKAKIVGVRTIAPKPPLGLPPGPELASSFPDSADHPGGPLSRAERVLLSNIKDAVFRARVDVERLYRVVGAVTGMQRVEAARALSLKALDKVLDAIKSRRAGAPLAEGAGLCKRCGGSGYAPGSDGGSRWPNNLACFDCKGTGGRVGLPAAREAMTEPDPRAPTSQQERT